MLKQWMRTLLTLLLALALLAGTALAEDALEIGKEPGDGRDAIIGNVEAPEALGALPELDLDDGALASADVSLSPGDEAVNAKGGRVAKIDPHLMIDRSTTLTAGDRELYPGK